MTLWVTYRNLVGVPSYHYDPIFGRAAHQAIRRKRPDVVALELPAGISDEVAWALRCWPAATGSITPGSIMPWVPGDSMVEACRAAYTLRIPVAFIDLDLAETPIEDAAFPLPGPEFARVGGSFRDLVDAALPTPTDSTLAREAFMAGRLDELMARHRLVLWVGGMAHWARIVARLERGDFAGPTVQSPRPAACRRVRLAGSALLRLTGRLPFLVAQYAQHPTSYDEADATRRLALEAARLNRRRAAARQTRSEPADLEPEEPGAPIDIVRVLLYARNLAASRRISERPGLTDLLTAASATIGKRYAGQVYTLAMQLDRKDAAEKPEFRDLSVLTYEIIRNQQGFRCEGHWISIEPYWPPARPPIELWVPAPEEVRRKQEPSYRHGPPAQAGEPRFWAAYPHDERAYEAYVACVLGQASLHGAHEMHSEPFLAGLRDGIDVRATLRHWDAGRIYVREDREEHLTVTNGAIDYTSGREKSRILRGLNSAGGPRERGGWVDPSCAGIGSASRTVGSDVLQNEPCHVTLQHREFSLITLDAPTGLKAAGPDSFYSRVIVPLLHLPAERDNLYGWLEVMFAFCRGKPFAYYSRYAPSSHVHQIASQYRVRVLHRPLRLIPSVLLRRHRAFRFLWVTRRQWEAIVAGVREGQTAWAPDAVQIP